MSKFSPAQIKPEVARSIIQALEVKTLYDVGIDFGFDKHYKDARSVKAAVYQVYSHAKADPTKYGLKQELVDAVTAALQKRTPATITENRTLREKLDDENNKSFSELVLSGRVKAMKLLHTKMDRVARSKKQIDETNLSTLAQTAGILFDKGQIISGEATENVALLAKIKSDMSPAEAIEAVLKMREANQADKDRTNKKK